jgi:hypothetical protein
VDRPGDAPHAAFCGCWYDIRMILVHLRALAAMFLAALMEATAALIAKARPNCAWTCAAA